MVSRRHVSCYHQTSAKNLNERPLRCYQLFAFTCLFVVRLFAHVATSCRQPVRQSRLPNLKPNHGCVFSQQTRHFLLHPSTLFPPHSFSLSGNLPCTRSLIFSRSASKQPQQRETSSTCILASSSPPLASWPAWPVPRIVRPPDSFSLY